MNVIGLMLTTAAAVLMYYYPPRGITYYTSEGQPHVQWVGDSTKHGKSHAKWQMRLSRISPCLLAAGFIFQLLAAFLPFCFLNGS